MLYKTLSAAVYGIDANLIEVEVDIAPFKAEEPKFTTVGLPDAAVRESRERIRVGTEEQRLRYTSDHHHHQPGSGRHSQGGFRLRPPHGPRHSWGVWRH